MHLVEESHASRGRFYNINESTIRSINAKEKISSDSVAATYPEL